MNSTPENAPRRDRSPRTRHRAREEDADLARSANGLGEDDFAPPVQTTLHLMRASMASAMALSLGAVAVTVGGMARMMSLRAQSRPDRGDDDEGQAG